MVWGFSVCAIARTPIPLALIRTARVHGGCLEFAAPSAKPSEALAVETTLRRGVGPHRLALPGLTTEQRKRLIAGANAQLRVNIAQMPFHGLGRESELSSDLLVWEGLSEQTHDLLLP